MTSIIRFFTTHRMIPVIMLCLSVMLSTSCQSPTAPMSSLDLEFGRCLGQLDQSTSCSSQIFRPLPRGEIGCWGLESTRSDQSFKTRLNWNGTGLNLSDPLALNDFPFNEGEQVNMYLILFDSLETASLCDDIALAERCENITGCLAKLSRSNLSLSFNTPLGFHDELNQCFVETPQINSVELCDDAIDSDCDGIIDENCIMPGECMPNDIRICENACGRSEQICIDGVYTACQMPVDEVCTNDLDSTEAQDEDCDGVIDEGCGGCTEGESRACSISCRDGLEYCQNGSFQGCDAPPPTDEICADQIDNDCDGTVDEDCPDCIDGDSRECGSLCGIGEEVCVDGSYTACTAVMPVPEICGDQIDNDCDGQTDEDCDVCTPSSEVCDGIDNNCNGQVDEGTMAYQDCLASRENCAGQVPGYILCDESGAQRCIPNESLFISGEEVCDGIDNNCDGLIDNINGLNLSCNGEVNEQCAYSQLTCTPGALGEVQDTSCDFTQVPTEVCDGVDNDCNGQTDEMDLSQNSCIAFCNRAGRESCVDGEVICEPIEALPQEQCGDGIDNNCNGEIDENCCATEETLCDGQDDNCNGQIDEGVCGSLIYNHCEARLAWWNNSANPNLNYGNLAWNDWPPVDGYPEYCTVNENTNRNNYSCDTARAQTNFQVVNIIGSSVSNDHWIGLGWSCQASPQLTAYQQALISWANSHCHIALAYQDIGNQAAINTLDKSTCPQYSQHVQNFTPRCIQTQSTHRYSAIELEGGVNFDDFFALSFYCDANQAPNGSVGPNLVQSIQNQFQVYFGSDQRSNPYNDGQTRWHNLPADDVDNFGTVRGVGTSSNGTWNGFILNGTLRQPHRLGIMTYIRPPN